VKIRKATLDDVEIISRIHALSWKTAYKGIVPQVYLDEFKEDFWVSAFTNWLKDNHLTVQLMIVDDQKIGCVSYGKSRDQSLPDWAEVVSLYLLPEYFGKGYGRKLLEVALSDIKEAGFKNVYLWVLNENQRARRFYEKNNWQCKAEDEYICEISGKKLTDIRYIYSFEE